VRWCCDVCGAMVMQVACVPPPLSVAFPPPCRFRQLALDSWPGQHLPACLPACLPTPLTTSAPALLLQGEIERTEEMLPGFEEAERPSKKGGKRRAEEEGAAGEGAAAPTAAAKVKPRLRCCCSPCTA
jgi:hypothetical protein